MVRITLPFFQLAADLDHFRALLLVINVIPDAQAVEMLEPTLDLERPFYSLGYVSSIHAWYRQSKIPASRYEKYANVQNVRAASHLVSIWLMFVIEH